MRVCVFCGSSPGRERYMAAARQVGENLALRGIGVVYGGARVGTMGAVADGALAAGGTVVGVITRDLVDWEVAHDGLTELHVVDTMHERKARMASLSDAFVALPGGAGTLDELFEAWTWAQLGLHTKPVGLLDVAGYFSHLTRFIDHMVAEGFMSASSRDALMVDADLDRLLERYGGYEPPRRHRPSAPPTHQAAEPLP